MVMGKLRRRQHPPAPAAQPCKPMRYYRPTEVLLDLTTQTMLPLAQYAPCVRPSGHVGPHRAIVDEKLFEYL